MSREMLQEIGGRIRLLRQSRGINLGELADLVGRSKATMSMYESGQTAMDIVVFARICRVLHVPASYLLEREEGTQADVPLIQSGFGDRRRWYLYHMLRGKAVTSVLLLNDPEEEAPGYQATLYYNASRVEAPYHCNCTYRGTARIYPSHATVLLSNEFNPIETLFLNFSVPILNVQVVAGVYSGLDAETMMPVARKAVLSAYPMGEEVILPLLSLDRKERQRLGEGTLLVPMLSDMLDQ